MGVMMVGMGDQDRVEAVYRSVHPRLWRSLLSYTGDAELASDAEAEAFAQVLRRGDAVDDVRGVGVAQLRSVSPRVCWQRGRAPTNCGRRRVSTPSTGSVAEFLGLLAELSPQQRACVALRYVGEYTSPEIGELLGTSAGTVRVQLHRAHAALRDTIREAEHA